MYILYIEYIIINCKNRNRETVQRGGLEYTADEWNNPHSTISVNSEGALRHHLHCYIRRGYCRRMQPPKTRHTRTAKRVSTAPSPNTVSNVEGVNASMVSRGGHSVSSPAGRSSALRPNCRHIYIYIHCRIRSGTRYITEEMLLSTINAGGYTTRGR